MFEVRVETDFAAAHFLKDYNGKCENLHGHNYKVYAHVKGSVLNEGGMLLDFSCLKNALRAVTKKLDHTNLNDLRDSNGNDIFMQNPSAERIAYYIFNEILSELQAQGINLKKQEALKEGVMPYLYAVDVFETDTSRARYCID